MGAGGRPRRESLHNTEKRGRGRPRKDEIVTKPVTVHHDPRIKEENKLKYAEQTVRNAENIYKKYKSPRPNPLNIEDIKLCPEAKEVWEYIFSIRERDDVTRYFQNGQELLVAFEAYCRYIRRHHFVEKYTDALGEERLMPIVPNQNNFSEWLGIPRFRMGSSLGQHGVLDQYKAMLADLLSEGAMIGAYQQSAGIFSLKNLCDWADKTESKVSKDDSLSLEEAKNIMAQLGYDRRLLENGENT